MGRNLDTTRDFYAVISRGELRGCLFGDRLCLERLHPLSSAEVGPRRGHLAGHDAS